MGIHTAEGRAEETAVAWELRGERRRRGERSVASVTLAPCARVCGKGVGLWASGPSPTERT